MNTETEIWKPINDYENRYLISSFGRIKSLARFVNAKNNSKAWKPEYIIKLSVDNDGYPMIVLHKDGQRKTRRVHRLVAETFLPNPKNKEQINHIDRDKSNNHISNLEWVTNRENTIHRFETDGYNVGVTKKLRCYTAKISVDYKTIFLGCFKSENQAKEAYLNAKSKIGLGSSLQPLT